MCEDEEDAVVVGSTPAQCHNHILQTINSTLDMDLLTVRYVLFLEEAVVFCLEISFRKLVHHAIGKTVISETSVIAGRGNLK